MPDTTPTRPARARAPHSLPRLTRLLADYYRPRIAGRFLPEERRPEPEAKHQLRYQRQLWPAAKRQSPVAKHIRAALATRHGRT